MAVAKRRYLDILLGLFVAAGIILLGTFIFLIGKERRLFDTSSHVSAYFPNVAGLAVGAEVLLAGVMVGHVSEIQFPKLKSKDARTAGKIRVVMRISSDMLQWVRQDSVAHIDGKGLLGDKLINIGLGSANAPPIPDGGVLLSVAPLDLNEVLSKAQSAIDDISGSFLGARKLLEGFTAEGGDKALADAARSMKNIIHEVEVGDGIVHKLVYDKKTGKDFQEGLSGVSSIVGSVKRTAAHVDTILNEVEKGNGLIHALVYDKKGADIARQANEILESINVVLAEVRNGKGVLHSLVYDSKEGQNLISSLNAAAVDLQTIVANVKSGQGTLGRLLVDPSVYEDLKLILSQVRRNEILKSLVRYSISKKESQDAEKNPPVTP